MTLPRQKLREIEFLLLFSQENSEEGEKELFNLVMDTLKVTKKSLREASVKVHHILNRINDIDQIIQKVSPAFALERIQKIERNILRLAIFEILYDDEPIEKVAIAEGIRLAKKFSTQESVLFVNALLDAVYKQKIGQEVDCKSIEDQSRRFVDAQNLAQEAAKKDNPTSENHLDSLVE